MDDLKERLRASRAAWENGRGVPTELEAEAADRIQQLEAERDAAYALLREGVNSLTESGTSGEGSLIYRHEQLTRWVRSARKLTGDAAKTT